MNIIKKIASAIEMSFDIPESEKEEAEKAKEEFKKFISILDIAKKHLNLIYDPFKETQDQESDLYEYRGAIFKYKEKIKENFNKVKASAFMSILKFNYFNSDTKILELINSFRDSISDLEKRINILLDILDDLKNKDFKKNLVKIIDEIESNSFEIEKMVKDRIIDYIDSNILGKNWVNDTGNELKTEIKDKIPYVTQLFEERENALKRGKI